MISNTHVTFTDIQNEFPGEDGSVGQSITDYYAGSKYVPANTTNYLGEQIPSSGPISFTNFQGAEKVIRIRPIVTLNASLATPADVNENTQITLTTVYSGQWDNISFNWTGPYITNTNQATVTFSPPSVDADTPVTLTCIVTAVGGTLYQGVVVRTLSVTFNIKDIPKTRVGTPVPTVSATTTEPPTVNTSWTAIPNADNYSVRYDYGENTVIRTVTGTTDSFSVAPGTTVTVSVRANVDSSDPTYKSSFYSSPLSATPTTPAVFNPPRNISASFTTSSVTGSWQAPATGSTGVNRSPVTLSHYQVAVTSGLGTNPPSSSAWVNVYDTSYTLYTLSPDTNYRIYVRSVYNYTGSIKNELSSIVSVTGRSQLLPRLAQPTSFTATNGNRYVTFNWSTVANAVAYLIRYRAVGTSTWTTVQFDGQTTNTSQITGLTNGTTYQFEIAARGDQTSHRSSVYGNRITATPEGTTPLPVHDSPSNLQVVAGLANSLNVSFSTVDNAVSYTLQWKKTTDTSWSSTDVNDTGANTITWPISGLEQTTYNVRVKTNADDDHQESGYTETTGTVLPEVSLTASLADVSVNEGQTITIEPTTSGNFDNATYNWSGEHLTFTGQRVVTFNAPTVSANTAFPISCDINATGGTNYVGSVQQTVTGNVNVINVPTTLIFSIVAPTGQFDPFDDVTLNTNLSGTYTDVNINWSASSGIITPSSNGRSATFTCPFANVQRTYTITATATAQPGNITVTDTATVTVRAGTGLPP